MKPDICVRPSRNAANPGAVLGFVARAAGGALDRQLRRSAGAPLHPQTGAQKPVLSKLVVFEAHLQSMIRSNDWGQRSLLLWDSQWAGIGSKQGVAKVATISMQLSMLRMRTGSKLLDKPALRCGQSAQALSANVHQDNMPMPGGVDYARKR